MTGIDFWQQQEARSQDESGPLSKSAFGFRVQLSRQSVLDGDATMFRRSTLAIFAVFSLAGPLPSVLAEITPQGDVNLSADLYGYSTTAVGQSAVGTLTIDNGSDLSSQAGAIGIDSTGTGTVNITGAGSCWTYTNSLYVGDSGNATLNIVNGGSLTGATNGFSFVGYMSSSTGAVMVSGSGSTWTGPMPIYVGYYGNATLSITNGGNVSSGGGMIGANRGSTAIVILDGPGSNWTVDNYVSIGGHVSGFDMNQDGGNGTLLIKNGGSFLSETTPNPSAIGCEPNSTGAVIVKGANSTFTLNSSLSIGDYGTGSLSVVGCAAAAVKNVSIGGTSFVAVDIGRGSSLTVGGGTGTITNNGTIRFLAGAGVPVNNSITYSPISAGTWSGSGTCQPIGGTWDSDSRKFTASSVTTGTSGSAVALDLSSVQRAVVNDNCPGGTGWQVGASLPAATSSSPITLTATAMTGATLAALENQLPTNESILSGWDFLTTGYTVSSTNPVYVSFNVGAGYTADNLDLWHYDGSAWTQYNPTDLTYDGTFASFTATSFSGYAVAGIAVPEPGTLALLAAGMLGLLARAWRWRKHRA
jgi:T5SS/PEP-CTERM-associated repeat protein